MRRRKAMAAGSSARASSRNRCNSDMLASSLSSTATMYQPLHPGQPEQDPIGSKGPSSPPRKRRGSGGPGLPLAGNRGHRSSLILGSRFRGNDDFNSSDGGLQRPDDPPAPDVRPLAIGRDDDRTVEHEIARFDLPGAFLGNAVQRALVRRPARLPTGFV